jgi:uncharacterized iron-regulated membrane protein
MGFRQFLLVTHRWLGLGSSLLLAIAGLTGALLVWPDAIPARSFIEGVHQELGVGKTGWYFVLLATVAGILLQAGGLVLWWKTKRLRIRRGAGVWRLSYDVHGTVGVLAFVVMLALGVSGLGRVAVRQVPDTVLSEHTKGTISQWHATRGFSWPAKVLFAAGSLGFAVQGVTGVIVWWKPRRNAPDAGAR